MTSYVIFNKGYQPAKTATKPGSGNRYSEDFLFSFANPLLALFMNPFFDNHPEPVVWEAKASGRLYNDNLRVISTKLKFVKSLEIEPPTLEQCRRFGMIAATSIYTSKPFCAWCQDWIDDKDRTEETTKKVDTIVEAEELPHQGSARAVLASVLGSPEYPSFQEDYRSYASSAAWRAWSDSEQRLNLVQIANLASGGK